MPILDKWNLQITTDQVLRAQGTDPDIIRLRRPALVATTEEAISRGQYTLEPKVLYQEFQVKSFIHERLELTPPLPENGRYYLKGQLIAQHLAQSQRIIVMLCTIGSALDETVSSLFKTNPLLAIALDGVGSVAVELLANQACNYFENLVKDEGLKTSIPLNPGMIGWPVDIGQPQIFSLLDSEEINVTLTESCMMVPNKSLSMVLGIGKEIYAAGTPCEYCNLKGICKYQDHYA